MPDGSIEPGSGLGATRAATGEVKNIVDHPRVTGEKLGSASIALPLPDRRTDEAWEMAAALSIGLALGVSFALMVRAR